MLENIALFKYHAPHDTGFCWRVDGAMRYVPPDEVKNVPDFQKAIDILSFRPNVDYAGEGVIHRRGRLCQEWSGRRHVFAGQRIDDAR